MPPPRWTIITAIGVINASQKINGIHTPLTTKVKVIVAKNIATIIKMIFFMILINSLINIIYTIEESVNSIMYVLNILVGQLKVLTHQKMKVNFILIFLHEV